MDVTPSILWQARAKVQFALVAVAVARKHTLNYMENQGIRLEESVEPSGLLRLDLTASHLPVDISLSVGMALHSLRSALDTAIFTLLERAGAKGTSRLAFPMHETEDQLRNSFRKGKGSECPNCKHIKMAKDGNHMRLEVVLPGLEDMIFNRFKPWENGNYRLWALGKLDNIDKHRMIVPTFAEVTWQGSWNARSHAGGGRWETDCAYQMFPGQSINLAVTDKSIVVEDPGVFSTKLIFENGIPLGGVPVFEALEDLIQMAVGIIDTLEAKFG